MVRYLEKINLRDVYMKLVRQIQRCLLMNKRVCVGYNTKTEEWTNIHIGEYIHGNGLVITASSLVEKNGKLDSEENFTFAPEFSLFKELLINDKVGNGSDWIIFSLSPPTINSLKIFDVFGINQFCYLHLDELENNKLMKTKWHEVMDGIAKSLGIKILPINIKDRR